jgi:hypothetical protein
MQLLLDKTELIFCYLLMNTNSQVVVIVALLMNINSQVVVIVALYFYSMFTSVLYVDDAELQCVPGSFESVRDYVNVFEPLLFEECRAQLHSTWEELCDEATKDPHIQVCVKNVERCERGKEHFLFLF